MNVVRRHSLQSGRGERGRRDAWERTAMRKLKSHSLVLNSSPSLLPTDAAGASITSHNDDLAEVNQPLLQESSNLPSCRSLLSETLGRSEQLQERLAEVTDQLNRLRDSRQFVHDELVSQFEALERDVAALRSAALQKLQHVWEETARGYRKYQEELEKALAEIENTAKENSSAAINLHRHSVLSPDLPPPLLMSNSDSINKIQTTIKKSKVSIFMHEAESLEFATTSAIHKCRPGQRSRLIVHSLDKTGACVPYGRAHVEACIQDKLTKVKHRASVKDLNDGSYEVNFTLPAAGVCTLYISLWNKRLRNATTLVHCVLSPRGPKPSRIPRPVHGSAHNLHLRFSLPPGHGASESDDSGLPSQNWKRPKHGSLPDVLCISGPSLTQYSPAQTPEIAIEAENPAKTHERAKVDDEDNLYVSRWVQECSRLHSSGNLDAPQDVAVDYDQAEVAKVAAVQEHSSSTFTSDFIRQIGQLGTKPGTFRNPQSACCVGSLMWVADSSAGTVQALDFSTGDFRCSIGHAERLRRPVGVCRFGERLLVADYESGCVLQFTGDARLMQKIGSGRLLGPKGLCVDNKGRIIVVDNKASCLYIFDKWGQLIRKIANQRGVADSRLAGPHYVASVGDDEAVVTDFHNHKVKIFNLSSGAVRLSVGSKGEGMGQFSGPTGVAVLNQKRMVVADWGNSRLQTFDESGSFLSYVDTADSKLHGPQGISLLLGQGFSAQQEILVADSGNHCIKLFKCGEEAGVTDYNTDIKGFSSQF